MFNALNIYIKIVIKNRRNVQRVEQIWLKNVQYVEHFEFFVLEKKKEDDCFSHPLKITTKKTTLYFFLRLAKA